MGLQHLKAIAGIGGATVVGIADPAADAGQVRQALGVDAPLFADAAEMLGTARPDVVHIVTPPHTHVRLATMALEAGAHVYIEKPFTPTRAEAETILSLAAARGLSACAGHQCLFDDPSLAALASLADIGTLVHVESYFSFRTARRTITPVDQAKDILPHAVYPLVEQLRAASGGGIDERFALKGLDVRASGDVYALVRLGEVTGVVLVTLSGRPVEQYQHLVGSNGAFRVDYITGGLTRLVGPGSGPGVLITPYRRALQGLRGATSGIYALVRGRRSTYPGLRTLIARFYQSIADGSAPPLSPTSILDTVDICEQIGAALDVADREAERLAEVRLAERERALAPPTAGVGPVLVTGGTGLLGRQVAAELRAAGFPVRVLARRVPRYGARVPGVEYVVGDLAGPLAPELFASVSLVAHCAAETAGGQEEHRRNSIEATRHVFEAAARAGVRDIVHVSSIAILKTSREVGGEITENTPIDAGHLRRGPYVWGKAESELLARQLGADLGDYTAYAPPGRLGREVGPRFIAIGPKRRALSVCDVGTAARVIRSYAQNLGAAPDVVNLVESPPPTRRELVRRLLDRRPDLRVWWVPAVLLRLMSGPLKLVQRVALGAKEPLDVYAAFASEPYRTDVAAQVIAAAGPPAASSTPT
jgi:predicted dehydrogenase/nucleoside-diphosphate-sugar epimerase